MKELKKIKDDIYEKVLQVAELVPGELVPLVSKLSTHVRLNRFQKRIDAHEEEIKRVFQIISQEDYNFFAEKIGVMVFEKILNDHEDEKAELLIIGFANCVENKIKKEDKIIMYFDLLSDLRCFDLKRLITIAEKTDERPFPRPKNFDEEILTMHSDYKLKRHRLIDASTTWSSEGGEEIDNRKPPTLTEVGRDFIKFIGLINWQWENRG